MRRFDWERVESRRFGDVFKGGSAVPDAAVEVEPVRDRLSPRCLKVLAEHHVRQTVAVYISEADAADHVVAAGVFPCEDLTRAWCFAEAAATVIEEKDVAG